MYQPGNGTNTAPTRPFPAQIDDQGQSSPRRLRVLMVDDSTEDAALIVHALNLGGYEVVNLVVDTAAGMRSALLGADWDVITSDHAMPQFSAPAALILATELRPRIPFMIVSGEIDINLAVSLMKSGAHDYIQKHELSRLAPAVARELREIEGRIDPQFADAATLARSESRYQRLFATARDGILILDAESGRIIDVNPYLIEMLGYTKEDFLEKELWELGAIHDKEASKRAFIELQKTGFVRYEDQPLETRDRQLIPVEFVSNVYFVNQAKVAQCNIRNIAERKQAEEESRERSDELARRVQERTAELEAANRELETFNSAVSHDLRAPLRRIMGFTDVLLEGAIASADDSSAQAIASIRGSVERMNALIRALLELSQLSRAAVKRQWTDLSALAQLIGTELRMSQPARSVEFTIAEGLEVRGDNELLRIALGNLFGNAWKFTGRQPIAHIEFGASPQSDGQIAYFVRDDGAGFDSARSSELFCAFQRLHNERDFPGLGIGLATVHRIVHLHGGRVWAESVEGSGATFFFTLGESKHPPQRTDTVSCPG